MALQKITQAKPGEFLVRGRRTKTGVALDICAGEGITLEKESWLRRLVNGQAPTLLEAHYKERNHVSGAIGDGSFNLLKLLEEHGMDLSTLRISLFLKESAPPLPKIIRNSQQVPGRLTGKWGRDEDGCFDFMSTWAGPCTRRCSSVLLSWLASHYVDRFPDTVRREHAYTLMAELPRQGFSVSSLQFEVFHRDSPRFKSKVFSNSALPNSSE